MILQRFVPLVLCLLMGGCVLQSKTPNFKESDGVALPEALVTKYVMENFADGAWSPENGTVSFSTSGKHYVVTAEYSEKSDKIDVLFVALGTGTWVMQTAAKDSPFAYVIAEAKGDILLMRPLSCDELQKRDDVKTFVRFDKSDCFLDEKAGLDKFKILAANPGEAKIRLRPVK
jgi:hypothetical protein